MLQQMRIKTLSARLFLILSAWTLIAVAIIALLISADYRNNAERRFADLLVANIYTLMGAVRLDEQGQLTNPPALGDARYGEYNSGWYWSISSLKSPGNKLASPSLPASIINIIADTKLDEDFQRTFSQTDEAGNQLAGLENQVILGDGDESFSFRITGNKSEVDREVSAFVWRLLIILSVFGLSLVLASYFIVRFGLRPLARATGELGDIRDGNAELLEGTYPQEIQPLIDETNALISSNKAIIERARTQVGNLAHSLKTPIAVVQNEIGEAKSGSSRLILEQIGQMQQQIQLYLDRARISARHGTITSRTNVEANIEKLVKVIAKLNPHLDIQFAKPSTPSMMFAGEESDFQEILGNLLENSAKFARSDIRVKLIPLNGNEISMTIEDDGPGLSDEEIEAARKRGMRLDEQKPGSGLGLSIVEDILKEYGGKLQMGRSDLGGLKAIVVLPRANPK